MQENKIYKLSEVEHVLKRPGQYIGSLNYCSKEMFLYKDNKFVFTNVSYIPGLDKCLNEILDNRIDEAIRTNFESTKHLLLLMIMEEVFHVHQQ